MVYKEISFLTIYFYMLLIWFKIDFISYGALTLKFVHNGNYSNYYGLFRCD